jgi:hypothetical protein
MIKMRGLLTLTLKEHLRGQIVWVSGFVIVLLMLLVTLISGAALTHESRVLDVFSYFISDQILLFLGIFFGASICSHDFSSRGIAELLIPSGCSRSAILIVRIIGFAIVLLSIAIVIFSVHSFLLPHFAEFPRTPDRKAHFAMFILSYLKSITGLSVATSIGCIARPVFAVLGSLTLFSVGHLTASLDTLINASGSAVASDELGAFSAFFYKLFSIWNPGVLVLESIRGEWILPNLQAFTVACLWAAGVILTSLGLALMTLTRIDIRA